MVLKKVQAHSLILSVCVGMATLSSQAHSAPFHGCTFYKSRLKEWSWPGGLNTGCANFSLNSGACQKVKCIATACITYSGTLFTGWIPEFFIEVTSRAGKSAFAETSDGSLLKEHLAIADKKWREHGDINPTPIGARQELHDGEIDAKLLFARALSVPYGAVGWSFPVVGISGGQAVPTCYRAISELVPETWADDTDSGDRYLAAKWAPVTSKMCTMGAVVNGVIGSVGGGSSGDVKCAMALSAKLQQTKAKAGASAYNPMKQCMGVLGGLLPRTGWTADSSHPYTAAQQIAWRLASLSEDYFNTGIGVQGDDKWQVIWPAMIRAECFAPGSLLRTSTMEPSTFFSPRLDLPENEGLSDVVFAIWRKHTKCLEPWEGVAAQADFNGLQAVRSAACAEINANDGMP
jgi:hypothetical protein